MNTEYAIKYITPWNDFIGMLDNTKVFHVQQSVIRITAGAKRSVLNGKFRMLNPSERGHLNPSSYCDVGRFFYGAFKF